MNNSMQHLKSLKNQNRGAALGRPAMKLLEFGNGAYICCQADKRNRDDAVLASVRRKDFSTASITLHRRQ